MRTLCRHLHVSKSGYYEWQTRKPCQRTLANRVMTERIRAIHERSDASYGMPRIHAELRDMGEIISKKRVARLMHLAQIKGVSRRRGFVVTTQRDLRQKAAPDLVQRQFVTGGINQLWVADMTYVPTWAGFIYLAVVMDVFSRKVVGWAFGERMTPDLVIAALKTEARLAIFTWIEAWYNPHRRHKGIQQQSPINFERSIDQQKKTANQLPNCL